MIRALYLWALVLIGLNLFLWKTASHSHPEWHFFRLNGVAMRTNTTSGKVEVLDLRSGRYVPYDVMVNEVKK